MGKQSVKQLAAMGMGLVVFLFIGWSLRDLERAKVVRYLASGFGLVLLGVNLLFGEEMYGARNWIMIGPISFQPSELVKLCFIFVGASTMDRIVTRRNLALFIVYSLVICGCLALMNDFGTALIFLAAFLVIAYLRSGNFATIALVSSALGVGGITALRFLKPHVLRRFASWRHVWEVPLEGGYQQTRAMMCIASGGLLGLGGGNGWLKYVAASDTDLVFATVSEEWGLIIALLSVVVVCVGTFLLCVLEPELDFVRLLFEEVSAFGTVGLSTGITPDLSVASKLVLIFTMYIGRLGAFTLFSLWIDRPDPSIRYTEEMITIG